MIIKGKDTQIKADDDIVHQVSNWELNLPVTLEDVTVQGDGWHRQEDVLQEWGLLIECFRDADDSGQTNITTGCLNETDVKFKIRTGTEGFWLLFGKIRMRIFTSAVEIIKTRYEITGNNGLLPPRPADGGYTYEELGMFSYGQLGKMTYTEIEEGTY